MRVLIADDQPSVRSALKLLIEQHPNATVVGEVTSGEEVLEWLLAGSADLALLDWELPGQPGIDLLPLVLSRQPALSVIVLDTHPETRQQAMAQGARDFILKGEPPEHLLDAITSGGRRGENAEMIA